MITSRETLLRLSHYFSGRALPSLAHPPAKGEHIPFGIPMCGFAAFLFCSFYYFFKLGQCFVYLSDISCTCHSTVGLSAALTACYS